MISPGLRPTVKRAGPMGRGVSATAHVTATTHVTAAAADSMATTTGPLRKRGDRKHERHHYHSYVFFHVRLPETLDTERLEGNQEARQGCQA